jgi:hypothetical protein
MEVTRKQVLEQFTRKPYAPPSKLCPLRQMLGHLCRRQFGNSSTGSYPSSGTDPLPTASRSSFTARSLSHQLGLRRHQYLQLPTRLFANFGTTIRAEWETLHTLPASPNRAMRPAPCGRTSPELPRRQTVPTGSHRRLGENQRHHGPSRGHAFQLS